MSLKKKLNRRLSSWRELHPTASPDQVRHRAKRIAEKLEQRQQRQAKP